MAPLGATPKTTLPSSSSWRASTLASKLVSIVPGCHKSHSEPSYDYDCQTSFSHERLFDSAELASQSSPGRQELPWLNGRNRRGRGSMAKWRHVTRKAAYCCPSFLFFKSPHAKVTVGGYGDKVPLCYSRRALYTYSATYNATYIACSCLPNRRTLFS